jgi:AraC-like DNA-binding protein
VKNLAAKPRSPALAALVKSFHYHETNFPFTLERIMPNGQAHLMVNLAEDEFRTYDPARPERTNRHSGAVLAGPHGSCTVIDTRAQRWLVAIEFRSGGAARFFSMPMSEFRDQIVSLEDAWGESGRSLRERLLAAPTPAAKFRVFEDLLLDHFKPGLDRGIEYAIGALRGGVPVSQVASRLGLLPRTLARRFSAEVGITPKRFGCVQRLQRVLSAIRHSSQPDWCTIAAEHGFTDQSHLIHDFRNLAHITPSGYKPRSSQRSNHVPIVMA